VTASPPPANRPRLLILESLATIAGGQAALLNLAPYLGQTHDLLALLPGEGPLTEALRQAGVRCFFAPLGSYTLVHKTAGDVFNYALRFPWLALSAWRLVMRERVNLVYANSTRTFAWGTLAATLAGRPIIWHQHNLLADRKTLMLVERIGQWRTVRRVIAASQAAATQFPTLQSKMVVIPNGIDTTFFHPDLAARARVRDEFSIPRDAFVAGIVGDLIPLKGQHMLLEAAQLGIAGAHYLIVGSARPGDAESCSYEAHLRQIAGEHVIFTGRRHDLPDVLNALDLLVVASERETGPLVLLEALACGVPAISTPVGRAPEILPPEALFPIGDPASLISRLQYWLADRQRLQAVGHAARSLAEKHLSAEIFRARIRAEVERSLLNGQRGGDITPPD
jgi:glycosyltransferase involved in cell wall biosynthesis